MGQSKSGETRPMNIETMDMIDMFDSVYIEALAQEFFEYQHCLNNVNINGDGFYDL